MRQPGQIIEAGFLKCVLVVGCVRLFDRVRQIPQLLSIIWNSHCSDADNTFCSPHNCTGVRTTFCFQHTHLEVCVYFTCTQCVMAKFFFWLSFFLSVCSDFMQEHILAFAYVKRILIVPWKVCVSSENRNMLAHEKTRQPVTTQESA